MFGSLLFQSSGVAQCGRGDLAKASGSRGGGRSAGGGGGGGAAAGEAEPLPNGVTKDITQERGINRTTYAFEVGGQEVAMIMTESANRPTNVTFRVGNDAFTSFDVGNLSRRDSDRAAIKLMKIMKHDASTKPDGFQYKTSAWTSDGFGARRAAAYERVGFSRPATGRPGQDQYAIVKNGKMQPDTKKLRSEENGVISQSRINRNIRQAQADRQLNRSGKPDAEASSGGSLSDFF